MAAPTVPKSKENLNLNKLLSKEKNSKLAKKHIICTDDYAWPRPAPPVEDSILQKFSEILKGQPNIVKPSTKSDESSVKTEKTRLRSQLLLGASCVFRSLERRELDCVLVSGTATPAITVEHIISLAREQGCPLLCLDKMATAFATATESKCLPLAIGFKKQDGDASSDFKPVADMVKEHAPVHKPTQRTNSSGVLSASQVKSVEKPLGNSGLRPMRLCRTDEEAVLSEITRVFKSALLSTVSTTATTKQGRKKKKKSKTKRGVKDCFEKDFHAQFEAGKRSVVVGLERNLLELVLVSQEVESLLSNCDQLRPLLQGQGSAKATVKVIVMPGMLGALKTLSSGCCGVCFVGIKKLHILPKESKQYFNSLIELCKESVQRSGNRESDEACSNQPITGSESDSAKVEGSGECLVSPVEAKETPMKQDTVEEEEEEEVDYSYLYILKKDSKDYADLQTEIKNRQVKMKQDLGFSSDFISLSGSSVVPTVSNKDTKDKSTKKAQEISSARSDKAVNPTSPEIAESKVEFKPTEAAISETVTKKASPQVFGFISFSSSSKDDSFSVDKTSEQKESAMDVSDTGSSSAPTGTKEITDSSELSFSVDKLKDNKTESIPSIHESHRDTATPSVIANETVDQLRPLNVLGDETSKAPASDVLTFTLDKTKSDWKEADSSCSNKKAQKRKLEADEECVFGETKGEHGLDYSAIDVSARSKKKTNALKKKVQSEEGFISFAYTKANIRTMVADPSKKRKKKKK